MTKFRLVKEGKNGRATRYSLTIHKYGFRSIFLSLMVFATLTTIAVVKPYETAAATEFNAAQKKVITRWNLYTKAMNEMQYDSSYEILSAYSKSVISKSEWETFVFSTVGKSNEKIFDVVIEPKGLMARVDVSSTSKFDAKSALYSQTWVYENDKWVRAFAEDRTKTRKQPNSDINTGGKNPIQFELIELKRSWYVSKSALQKETLYVPEITYKVKNTGNETIKYLMIRAEFYKLGTKELFGKTEEYIISSNDRPLDSSYTSEKKFMRCPVGFELIVDSEWMRQMIDEKNPLEVKLYFKHDVSGEWILYKEL